MSFIKGGYVDQRHDGIRDLIGTTAKEVSSDVEVEPHLIPSNDQPDESRLDLSIRDFWQRGQKAFLDIRICNPYAPTLRQLSLKKLLENNEKEKKRKYGRRVVDIEHGSFSPVVFTAFGGCSRETEKVLAVLTSKLSEKRKIDRSVVAGWLNTKLSFALLRAAILCVLKGNKGSNKKERRSGKYRNSRI